MWTQIRLFILIFAILSALLLAYVYVTYQALYSTSTYIVSDSSNVELSAEAWILFDAETGRRIASMDAGVVLPIASMTKLMTAEVALRSFDLAGTTTLSAAAVRTEGRAGRFAVGDVISIRELLFPLLIESSNDAAEALAEVRGREAFIQNMNIRAEELGMRSTHFADASGLSAGNVASAEDVSILARHIFTNYRYIFDITRLEIYIGTEHTWGNTNPISTAEGYLGGKHGFTDAAGRTLVAVFEQPLANNLVRPIGVVLLGSENLKADVEALRSYVAEHVSLEPAPSLRRVWYNSP